MEQAAARRQAVARLQRPRLQRRASKQPVKLRQAAVSGGLEAPLVVADACEEAGIGLVFVIRVGRVGLMASGS